MLASAHIASVTATPLACCWTGSFISLRSRLERKQPTMASSKDVRAPRGTKNVTRAFFEAIEGMPATQQEAIATAALAGIRDELKSRRLKTREAAARAKAKVKARVGVKATAKKNEPAARVAKAPAAKRRTAAAGRKQAAAATPRPPRKAPAKVVTRKQPRKPVSPPAPETDSE